MTNKGHAGEPAFRKTVTDQGVRIVTERMDNVRSVAVGIWFATGSRDENPEQSGVSHFLEHMMFKGTRKRSALRIAREIEQVGGHLNAFTTKELTTYYAHLLDERLPLAVDVLADMVSHSRFAEKDIRREQGVVLEEIATSDDTPEEVIHEDFAAVMFPGHSLGRPILGTKETVSAFTREHVADYWAERYTAENAVVVAAGNVDHERLVRMVEKKLELPGKSDYRREVFSNGKPKEIEFTRKKEIQQAHVILGTRGLPYGDRRRFALFLLNTVLGSGMSSRLFQTVRERNGLAYSIYSFHDAYSDCGMFGIYAGMEDRQVRKAVNLVRRELDRMMNKPLTAAELKRAKTQLKGGLMLGLESAANRMHRLARMEIYLGKYMPIDDLIEHIDAVTADEVRNLAGELFSEPMFASYLLPVNGRA